MKKALYEKPVLTKHENLSNITAESCDPTWQCSIEVPPPPPQ